MHRDGTVLRWLLQAELQRLLSLGMLDVLLELESCAANKLRMRVAARDACSNFQTGCTSHLSKGAKGRRGCTRRTGPQLRGLSLLVRLHGTVNTLSTQHRLQSSLNYHVKGGFAHRATVPGAAMGPGYGGSCEGVMSSTQGGNLRLRKLQ